MFLHKYDSIKTSEWQLLSLFLLIFRVKGQVMRSPAAGVVVTTRGQ